MASKKERQMARIRQMRAMLDKDRSEYTAEDKALLRGNINKHAGTDWATEGYEGERR